MAATMQEIRGWLERAKKQGATHLIVACDTWDWDDYPIEVMPGQDPEQMSLKLGNMQKLMECYALHLDIEAQLHEHRAKHFEAAPPEET